MLTQGAGELDRTDLYAYEIPRYTASVIYSVLWCCSSALNTKLLYYSDLEGHGWPIL